MNQQISPTLTDSGVLFTVTVDSLRHQCLIQKDALMQLTGSQPGNADLDEMTVFRSFEGKISGVARRLVAAGVQGGPLVLTRNTFAAPPVAS
ncbi:DUF1488 family protein [Noviherbaspirillum galbum]|uniref:DUF1488 domain-containing protein n=1 Tax=Noviherbaspirillum galbum TaxID=2709383 RepID=A0A6B3SW66_9BURK|nr:DUF1488 family protein [Noviherbaspirillum galbum]NEX64788.1 DUF1488 domain-containing protein [Noviherbaspirillum galbum]